jgi:GC-rich sequence DNA-binding factor
MGLYYSIHIKIKKVALPVLHHEVAHCWDALSTEGSKLAVAALEVMLTL